MISIINKYWLKLTGNYKKKYPWDVFSQPPKYEIIDIDENNYATIKRDNVVMNTKLLLFGNNEKLRRRIKIKKILNRCIT